MIHLHFSVTLTSFPAGKKPYLLKVPSNVHCGYVTIENSVCVCVCVHTCMNVNVRASLPESVLPLYHLSLESALRSPGLVASVFFTESSLWPYFLKVV